MSHPQFALATPARESTYVHVMQLLTLTHYNVRLSAYIFNERIGFAVAMPIHDGHFIGRFIASDCCCCECTCTCLRQSRHRLNNGCTRKHEQEHWAYSMAKILIGWRISNTTVEIKCKFAQPSEESIRINDSVSWWIVMQIQKINHAIENKYRKKAVRLSYRCAHE